MIFHLRTEIPESTSRELNHEISNLTAEEDRILKDQIRKNSALIGEYVARLDLLVNQERYPNTAVFIHKIRRRLELLMEENDTFRKVLWKNYQRIEMTAGAVSV
jgi:hypothetical protein